MSLRAALTRVPTACEALMPLAEIVSAHSYDNPAGRQGAGATTVPTAVTTTRGSSRTRPADGPRPGSARQVTRASKAVSRLRRPPLAAVGADGQLGARIAEQAEHVRAVHQVPAVVRVAVRHVPAVRHALAQPGVVCHAVPASVASGVSWPPRAGAAGAR